MNAFDAYSGFITAGNTVQPVGDWLDAHWSWLTIPAALIFAAWAIRRHIRRGLDDYRTINDRVMADRYADERPTPELQQPGTDPALLLDCIAVYGDSHELDRLRDAINQHRKENPQP